MFTYNAHVERVVDGDTIDVSIDLGFDIWHKVRLRLADIDTPEVSTEKGKLVKKFVIEFLEGKDVVIETTKPDKYGRYLATVFLNGESFNKALLTMEYAVAYNGGKKPAMII